MMQEYSTLRIRQDGPRVVTATIDAPPMNLIGPALVRDLVDCSMRWSPTT